ncbi:MAG TPA: HEAT repeat domain-containing protein [Blastocatellia bacterium]|nr:HEAT repeat domain-containing protein [Blastocatellia bacterium]
MGVLPALAIVLLIDQVSGSQAAPRRLVPGWLGSVSSGASGAVGAQAHDIQDEITSLLTTLIPEVSKSEKGIAVQPPSLQSRRFVHDRLLQIANKSEEGRSLVVRASVDVVAQGVVETLVRDNKWTVAVNVLGDLKASEAVECLVKNLNETGGDLVISIHYQPVMEALEKIGKSAVPRLIEALSDDNSAIRLKAGLTLVRIGKPAVGKLEDALRDGNAETKGGAALALAYIGSRRARAAVRNAIERETDAGILAKLKEAQQAGCLRWGDCK